MTDKTDGEPKTDKKVILIVEDDPVLARMYTEKFGFEGYEVLTARDGQEALDTSLSKKIDLILLDIMLPRMSGTDFLERLRQDEKGADLPVIVLTNLTEQEEKDRAIKLEVKEYLVKAMNTPEDVVVKVKEHLKEV